MHFFTVEFCKVYYKKSDRSLCLHIIYNNNIYDSVNYVILPTTEQMGFFRLPQRIIIIYVEIRPNVNKNRWLMMCM